MAAVTLVPPLRSPARDANTDPVAPSSPRRARAWGWAIVATIALLIGSVPVIGAWHGAARWDAFRAAAARTQAELEAREPTRAVLWGEAANERAWPHYERAFALMGKPDDPPHLAYLGRVEGRKLAGVANTEPARQGPTAGEAVATHAAALAALRDGAHASDGRRPMDWSKGFDLPVQNLLVARQLANAGVLAAILAAQSGDGMAAVRGLLDVLQLGRDLAHSPLLIEQMIGCAVLAIVTSNAVEWSGLPRHLDADALRALADGLASLDATLRLDADWLAAEAVLLANQGADALATGNATLGPIATWRHSFSPRLALAEHGLEQLRLAAAVQSLCADRGAVDVPTLHVLFAKAATSTNAATRILMPNLGSSTTTRLGTIASVRALRMAVQHAAGQTVTPLPDPSGGILQWTIGADRTAEFWSDHHKKLPRVRVPK